MISIGCHPSRSYETMETIVWSKIGKFLKLPYLPLLEESELLCVIEILVHSLHVLLQDLLNF